MSITATRSVRKSLKPEMQGHIDGMCSVYAVLNACKLMFGHEEPLDKRLFKFLCDANSELFPKLVYGGTEVAGLSRLLDASVEWVARTHLRDMTWSQPLRRRPMATVKEYFSYMGTELGRSRHARGVAIIGLAKPWGHWTVLRRVLPNRAFFFDSWGFPKTTDFDFFTFDEDRAGEGPRQKTLLVYHQTFFLSLEQERR